MSSSGLLTREAFLTYSSAYTELKIMWLFDSKVVMPCTIPRSNTTSLAMWEPSWKLLTHPPLSRRSKLTRCVSDNPVLRRNGTRVSNQCLFQNLKSTELYANTEFYYSLGFFLWVEKCIQKAKKQLGHFDASRTLTLTVLPTHPENDSAEGWYLGGTNYLDMIMLGNVFLLKVWEHHQPLGLYKNWYENIWLEVSRKIMNL